MQDHEMGTLARRRARRAIWNCGACKDKDIPGLIGRLGSPYCQQPVRARMDLRPCGSIIVPDRPSMMIGIAIGLETEDVARSGTPHIEEARRILRMPSSSI